MEENLHGIPASSQRELSSQLEKQTVPENSYSQNQNKATTKTKKEINSKPGNKGFVYFFFLTILPCWGTLPKSKASLYGYSLKETIKHTI